MLQLGFKRIIDKTGADPEDQTAQHAGIHRCVQIDFSAHILFKQVGNSLYLLGRQSDGRSDFRCDLPAFFGQTTKIRSGDRINGVKPAIFGQKPQKILRQRRKAALFGYCRDCLLQVPPAERRAFQQFAQIIACGCHRLQRLEIVRDRVEESPLVSKFKQSCGIAIIDRAMVSG